MWLSNQEAAVGHWQLIVLAAGKWVHDLREDLSEALWCYYSLPLALLGSILVYPVGGMFL